MPPPTQKHVTPGGKMSQSRRRSRDPHFDIDNEEMKRKDEQSSPSRLTKSNIGLAVFFLLATAFVLLSRNRWTVPTIPSLSFQNASPEAAKAPEDGILQLHPEKHALRQPTVIKKFWRITRCQRRPDGVLKSVYCINDGDLPGPTIEARPGDQLLVEVTNALEDEGLSFHWHGLTMRGFNDMDGAVGITQSPIKSGEMFTYNFTIQNHGTFWYHSHDAVQRAEGLYGGLVVHEPAESDAIVDLKDEYLLMAGDWYHRDAKDAFKFYSHPGSFGNEPVPDSLLVNGVGRYKCSDAVPARPIDCKPPSMSKIPSLRLGRSKPSLVRLVNTGSYTGISMSVPGAEIRPLRVDGGNAVSSSPTKSAGILYPGERVDLLVEPFSSSTESHDYFEVTIDDAQFKYPNEALTLQHRFPITWNDDGMPAATSKGSVERVDLQMLKGASAMSSFPATADETIVLYAVTEKLSHLENTPHGFINRTTWLPQQSPLTATGRDHWDDNQFVPHIERRSALPQWIDIVLNNLDEEGHPFHLHGYDFYVLSTYSSTYNWGSYNPFEDDELPGGSVQIDGAVKKDTVYVPRRGYAVLRVFMDNPGIWMFHCHNLWHQASGMAMAFEVE